MENSQERLLKTIVFFLEANKIPYMLTGAWSAIFYGRPRASHDIDFVVELHSNDLDRILQTFDQLSGEFIVQKTGIEDAIKRKVMFNIIHLPTMLKLDFWILTDGEFDKLRFKRRKKVKILNQFMQMATAEDTILQKLIWFKSGGGGIEKHLVDASFVYQIQEKNLDKKYLQEWLEKLGVEEYFQKLGEIDLEEYL